MRMIKSKQRVTYGNYDQICSYLQEPIETYLSPNTGINTPLPNSVMEGVYYIVMILTSLAATFTKLFKDV